MTCDIIRNLVFLLLGAFIGAISTFLASYALEKKKWTADAAILRKDEIYAPIYDDLRNRQNIMIWFERWVTFSRHYFGVWEKIKVTSKVLSVPEKLKNKLEGFIVLCNKYNESNSQLYSKLREVFPDKNENYDDFWVASILLKKLLLNQNISFDALVEYMESQRPSDRDLISILTVEALEAMERTIQELEEWRVISNIHLKYVDYLELLLDELSGRIERITKKYQSASSRL